MGEGHRRGEPDGSNTQRSADLPHTFSALSAAYFSLGQDVSYYTELRDVPWGTQVLHALRDIAYDNEAFRRAADEPVTETSLFRSIPKGTVLGQFRRIAHGGAILTAFTLRYELPTPAPSSFSEIDFTADPDSTLPTNVHALIGRNGTGKTTTLNNVAGRVANTLPSENEFVSLVQVAFSAFDVVENAGTHTPTPHAIVQIQSHEEQLDQLRRSLESCLTGPKALRLREFIGTIESDPLLESEDFATIIEHAGQRSTPATIVDEFAKAYQRMSAGHKVLLLAAVQLVHLVEERSLVLIDEPESHLHPPLLSSFIRAVTKLMTDRNALAIVSTHSPVVLQELPRDCVWLVSRSGNLQKAERPAIETFGENLSILTTEVFGLEVDESGFHRLLTDAVRNNPHSDADAIVGQFGGQIGSEGRALVYALVAIRDRGGRLA